MRWRLAGLLAAALAVVAAGGAAGRHGAARPAYGQAASGPADEIAVTLLHVNDCHGQLQSQTVAGQSVGGFARLSTAVQRVREEGASARVFLLHAGDILSRGDELTRQTLGAANLELINRLKFDAWTPGNGDFYDGLAALQARIRQAQFPVLAANVTLRATGKPLAKRFVIEQAGPVRVAFFGLCTLRKEHESAKPLELADAIETAQLLAPELRKQADVVVLISHLGFVQDSALAGKAPGIDVILGGHSHTLLRDGLPVQGPDRPVLIAQAGQLLRYLGRVDLKLARHSKGYQLQSAKASVIALDQTVPLDATVTAAIARLAETVKPPATAKARSQVASAPAVRAPATGR